ncbi:MAG: hypothetical protein OP8BY_0940 [Candidatus Saccharicenans subterraneus]|uniref:Uncharacterized protein n=1 Tax=Candidatus Saccharicenans subterraneus TaxID=2508984 RepID=A0A3E2BQJ6_9BACT|nr:MAG: hypothetical protein OP8BY_0940 [Candidatus Saccharicenans subterraneum]
MKVMSPNQEGLKPHHTGAFRRKEFQLDYPHRLCGILLSS